MMVKINGVKYNVAKKYNILQVCEEFNITIPKFCYHEKLTIAGNCRMCLVELKGVVKPVPSCSLPISENLEIFTESRVVKKAREGVLEFILLNHPLDCPICDQGGECDLQDQTLIYGNDKGRFYEMKKTALDKTCGYLIKTVMTRCIQCTRCIRFTKEIAGSCTFGIINRGEKMEISTFLQKVYHSEISGNIIDLCPVGALTSNPYSFIARPWELKSFNTIDLNDSLCVNIRVDIRNIDILRIIPRYNKNINDFWISDVTRFSFDAFKVNRILFPFLKNETTCINISWFNVLAFLLVNKNKYFNFICGNFLDLEAIFILKKFITKYGKYTINSFREVNVNCDVRDNFLFQNGINSLVMYSNLLLIGLNLRFENPILNVQIKGLVGKNLLRVYTIGSAFNYNYKTFNFGNYVNELFLLFAGKSALATIFQYRLVQNLVLCGSIFFLRRDFFLFNKCFKNAKFYGLNNFLTSIGLKEINLQNSLTKFNDSNLKFQDGVFSKEIIYLLNTDSFLLNNVVASFLIYQGHHNLNWQNDFFFNTNNYLLLPTLAFFEKSGMFLNFLGIYQKTKFILTPPNGARNDWKIFILLYKIFFKTQLFSTVSEVRYSILRNYNCKTLQKISHWFLRISHRFIMVCSQLINTIVNSYVTNHLVFNQILRASTVLAWHGRILQRDYCNFA